MSRKVTVAPRENVITHTHGTSWIVPLFNYADHDNIYGIRYQRKTNVGSSASSLNEDNSTVVVETLFMSGKTLVKNKRRFIVPNDTTVEIINAFSDKTQVIVFFEVRHV